MLTETYKKPVLHVEHCLYCGAVALSPFFKHKRGCLAQEFANYENNSIDLVCYLIGHNWQSDLGFPYCERCNVDFYSHDEPVSDIGTFLKKWINRFHHYKHRLFVRCPYCGDPEFILCVPVHHYDDCMPF